ncbi:pentapeptide repeat-containing protein [Plantactinospora sonchi]|uniref:Pentapeptide repeat-containing protein n=1 Tax=Plantactinospora sonchi TaxID=1544735 RepID=A0ABU7RWW1_9ACTN
MIRRAIKAMQRVMRRPAVWMPLTVLLAIGLLVVLLGPVAWWATPAKHLQGKDKADVRNATRQTLLAAVGGLVVLTGAAFTARTFYLSRRGQFTDRYTKAIAQLASDKLTERLGGIYALEHLMAESERDHETVVEVLAAFVREGTRDEAVSTGAIGPIGKKQIATLQPAVRPPTDVQAALTVLARRPQRTESNSVDLSETRAAGAVLSGAQLRGADLSRADLQSANLYGANLQGANLYRANLQGAFLLANLQGVNLFQANLQGANLEGVQLDGAILYEADLKHANLIHARLQRAFLHAATLEGADLYGAQLQGADLYGANLQNANLRRAHLQGANLDGAEGLTAELLTHATIDARTRLPKLLQEEWEAAQPFEGEVRT